MSFNVTDDAHSVTLAALGVVAIAGLSRNHRHLLGRGVVLTRRGIEGVTGVTCVPLVGPSDSASRRQRVPGRRRVSAIAADRRRLGIDQGAPLVEREGDRAGLLKAVREDRRVLERHWRGPSVTAVTSGIVVIEGIA